MKVKLIVWWQKYRKLIVTTAIIALAVLALIRVGYLIDAIGFNGYHTVTIATSHSGTSPTTVTRTEVEVPAKSFWDWLQLLIIPGVLAVGGYLFNYTTSRNDREATEKRTQAEREAAEKRAETEREIALDNQREAALQACIDRMAELLLVNGLRESKPGDEIRTIARMRIVAVVQGLDGIRKRILLIFLHEAGLINRNGAIIELWGVVFNHSDLRGIDLRNADLHGTSMSGTNFSGTLLSGADLSNANLRKAIFSGTDLGGVNLNGAFLEGAYLRDAILTKEQLAQAKSLKGATMPDGSIHP